jgi:hypothetical protein
VYAVPKWTLAAAAAQQRAKHRLLAPRSREICIAACRPGQEDVAGMTATSFVATADRRSTCLGRGSLHLPFSTLLESRNRESHGAGLDGEVAPEDRKERPAPSLVLQPHAVSQRGFLCSYRKLDKGDRLEALLPCCLLSCLLLPPPDQWLPLQRPRHPSSPP